MEDPGEQFGSDARTKQERLDWIAWETIDRAAARTTSPPGLAASGRPSNYAEFAELVVRKDY